VHSECVAITALLQPAAGFSPLTDLVLANRCLSGAVDFIRTIVVKFELFELYSLLELYEFY